MVWSTILSHESRKSKGNRSIGSWRLVLLFLSVGVAVGFLIASGFIDSVRAEHFEENAQWLWLPAIHTAVFDAGIYGVLVVNRKNL